MTRQYLISRRRVLGVLGAGTTVALAGCSGNDQEGSGNGDSGSGGNGTDSPSGSGGNGSGTEETDSGSQGTEDSGSTGSTGNEPGEYPTQETSGLMAEADQLADENEGAYAFRIEDYDFLNVEEFPNILDDHEESSLQELAETSNTVSYSEALYLAVNMETPGEMPSDDLYFLVPNHEDSGGDTSIYVNLENQGNNRDLSQTEIFIQANLDKAAGESAEQKRGYQADFFRDHVDPDGIVHAVDLDEHDYAVEALHSGFGSE